MHPQVRGYLDEEDNDDLCDEMSEAEDLSGLPSWAWDHDEVEDPWEDS